MTIQSKRAWRTADALPSAWNIQQIQPVTAGGHSPVVVAVLDTGLDHHHPSLPPRVYPTIDVVGRDWYTHDDATYDFSGTDGNGHGTHVAGIILAVARPSPVWILPVKVIPASGIGNDVQLAAGIERALAWRDPNDPQRRVRIMNLSLASPVVSERLTQVIRRVYAQGILVVGAAGNDGGAVDFPGSLPEVLTVGGTGVSGDWVPYSSYGDEVDIVAPGGEESQPVMSIWPLHMTTTDFSTGVVSKDLSAGLIGTSMAAPHVSGAAAVLWSTSPVLSRAQIRTRLLTMADPLSTGRAARTGFGRLNLFRAWNGTHHDAR